MAPPPPPALEYPIGQYARNSENVSYGNISARPSVQYEDTKSANTAESSKAMEAILERLNRLEQAQSTRGSGTAELEARCRGFDESIESIRRQVS